MPGFTIAATPIRKSNTQRNLRTMIDGPQARAQKHYLYVNNTLLITSRRDGANFCSRDEGSQTLLRTSIYIRTFVEQIPEQPKLAIYLGSQSS
jgi:hypothetical protein